MPLTAYIGILAHVFEINLNTRVTVVVTMVGLRILVSLGRRSLTLSEARRQERYLPSAFIHVVRLAGGEGVGCVAFLSDLRS